jgi:hypothetical protein
MSLAFASDAAGPKTGSKVASIYVDVNGGIFVTLSSGGLPGCYGDRGAYITTESVEGQAQLYSLILAAKLSGATVKALYNYTGVTSGWSMCHIHGMYLL